MLTPIPQPTMPRPPSEQGQQADLQSSGSLKAPHGDAPSEASLGQGTGQLAPQDGTAGGSLLRPSPRRQSTMSDDTVVWVIAAVKSKRQRAFFSCGMNEARAVQIWFQNLHSTFANADGIADAVGAVKRIRCIAAFESSFIADMPKKLRVWTKQAPAKEPTRTPRYIVTSMLQSLRLPGDPSENRYQVIGGVDATCDFSGSMSTASVRSVSVFSGGLGIKASMRGKSDGDVLGLKSCFRNAADRSDHASHGSLSLKLQVQSRRRAGKWMVHSSKGGRAVGIAPKRAASQAFGTTAGRWSHRLRLIEILNNSTSSESGDEGGPYEMERARGVPPAPAASSQHDVVAGKGSGPGISAAKQSVGAGKAQAA